jgi:hypothetical protein
MPTKEIGREKKNKISYNNPSDVMTVSVLLNMHACLVLGGFMMYDWTCFGS